MIDDGRGKIMNSRKFEKKILKWSKSKKITC